MNRVDMHFAHKLSVFSKSLSYLALCKKTQRFYIFPFILRNALDGPSPGISCKGFGLH